MDIEKISLRDLGTDFVATILEGSAVVDLSTATVLQIEFTSPGGKVTTKTASLVTDGTDGEIHYRRLAGDIDRKGIWSYIGVAAFTDNDVYHSVVPTLFEVIK